MSILRILISASILSLNACSPKSESESQPQIQSGDEVEISMLGKWRSSQNTNGTIRFLKGGVLVAEGDGQVQAGKFQFLDGDIIEIQIGEHIQTGKISFISRDEILLVATNSGTTELLKRISD